MAADHFQPRAPARGQGSFVWNVLSALGRVTGGNLRTTLTFRAHPAPTAQATVTLAAMYPGRHWRGLGRGEALDEHIAVEYLARGGRANQPSGLEARLRASRSAH